MAQQERKYTAKQKFRAKQSELGLCLDCNNKPSQGRARCNKCLALRRTNLAQRKLSSQNDGICCYCFSETKLPHHRYCIKCYCRDVASHHLGTSKRWEEILNLFHSQNDKCAISGVRMTLGMNCELDHIVPVSRGGSHDAENLQWVLMVCNRMKDNLLEHELLDMIEQIHYTMKNKCLKTP